jgi:hypothetical protein
LEKLLRGQEAGAVAASGVAAHAATAAPLPPRRPVTAMPGKLAAAVASLRKGSSSGHIKALGKEAGWWVAPPRPSDWSACSSLSPCP